MARPLTSYWWRKLWAALGGLTTDCWDVGIRPGHQVMTMIGGESRSHLSIRFNPHPQDGQCMQVLRNPRMCKRSALTGSTFKTSPVYNHQQSMGVRLRVEGSRSFMPFIYRCLACVFATSLRSFIAVYTTCTGLRSALCAAVHLLIRKDYIDASRQHPALPLHSTRFFRPVFELQYTPDVPIITMSF